HAPGDGRAGRQVGDALDVHVAGDLVGDDGGDVVAAGDAVVAVGEQVAVDLAGLVAAADHGQYLRVGQGRRQVEEDVDAVGRLVGRPDAELPVLVDAGLEGVERIDAADRLEAVDVDRLVPVAVDGGPAVAPLAESPDLNEV